MVSRIPLLNFPACPKNARTLLSNNSLENSYFQVEHTWVNKQKKFTPEQDLVNFTPDAYHLLGLTLGTAYEIAEGRFIHFDLSVHNLLNTLYKEYTDRFRYFAHLPGRQIQFVTTINF